jgi:hypothetical protein
MCATCSTHLILHDLVVVVVVAVAVAVAVAVVAAAAHGQHVRGGGENKEENKE